jgi:hypothetical protein
MCATVGNVQGRPHSLSDHGAYHRVLIAFACGLITLLSFGSPARPAGSSGLTRQFDNRVEQIEAPDPTPVSMVPFDARFAENLHQEVAEPPEPTDDDETCRCLLRLGVVLQFDLPAFGIQSGLDESSAGRERTPFRLRAFSGRGSPSV